MVPYTLNVVLSSSKTTVKEQSNYFVNNVLYGTRFAAWHIGNHYSTVWLTNKQVAINMEGGGWVDRPTCPLRYTATALDGSEQKHSCLYTGKHQLHSKLTTTWTISCTPHSSSGHITPSYHIPTNLRLSPSHIPQCSGNNYSVSPFIDILLLFKLHRRHMQHSIRAMTVAVRINPLR